MHWSSRADKNHGLISGVMPHTYITSVYWYASISILILSQYAYLAIMYRISTIKTPTSLWISRFKLHTSLWNIAVKTRIPAYRANEKDCLLLFRCSHIRPINMVKHQEVQLLWTHTFADKHLLKQCLNKDLTEYSYSPKKRKEIGCLCKSHYLKESFRHHILMTVINDEEMMIRKQKAATSINIKKTRLAGKD